MAIKEKSILSAQEAIKMIRNNHVVGIGGAGGGISEPTALIRALADQYRETGEPKALTLIHAAGLGDRANRGISPLAQKGLSRRVIGGHWDQSPRMAEMAANNEFEAYNFPMGIITKMYRASGAKEPGVLSKVGIGTFIDPRDRGGKINECATEDLVELINLNGEDWLFYKTISPNVCLIRGSTADTQGFISMEDDFFMDSYEMAVAAHNNGGIVIAQVSRIVQPGTLHPKSVKIPGYLVDALVLDESCGQIYDTPYNRFLSGDYKADIALSSQIPLNERKVIVRRALMEAKPGDVGNIGSGIADGIGAVANEEGVLDDFTLTVEMGVVGGVTLQGVSFGASVNMSGMISMPAQFDFYDGGGLDVSYLSFAEFDKEGNVNVTRFGGKIVGTGGFVNISQNSKKVVFCGTLTAGGIKVQPVNGRLEILQEGRFRKCPEHVQEITFNGKVARENGQKILYVTERAVFRLCNEGIELIEYAPGVDIEKDILAYLDFTPVISDNLKEMDARLFMDCPMQLKREWQRQYHL